MAPGERNKDQERSDQEAGERMRRGAPESGRKRERGRRNREEEAGEREGDEDEGR